MMQSSQSCMFAICTDLLTSKFPFLITQIHYFMVCCTLNIKAVFKVQKENNRQLTNEKGGKTYINYNVADVIGLTHFLPHILLSVFIS